MTDSLGRSSDGLLNPRITDSPLPAMNDSCPECNTGIVDGSAWRTDPEAAITTRVHTHCLNRRDVNRNVREEVEAMRDEQPEPEQAPATHAVDPEQLSNLGMARACLAAASTQVYSNTPAAVSALIGAVNELIQHLQKQETP